jgi:hypothetical protein
MDVADGRFSTDNADIHFIWRTVSQLRPGDKLRIDSYNEVSIDKGNSLSTCFKRTFNGDSRRRTVAYLLDVVRLTSTINSPKLTEAMVNAVEGMEGLKQTYANDASIVAKLDIVLEMIKLKSDNEATKT